MEQNPDRLTSIDANALLMKVADVAVFSPESLSIMEFKDQGDVTLASLLYRQNALVGDYFRRNWEAEFQREFNITLRSAGHRNYFSEFLSAAKVVPCSPDCG